MSVPIGTILGAPRGAILAAEILIDQDFETEAIVPRRRVCHRVFNIWPGRGF